MVDAHLREEEKCENFRKTGYKAGALRSVNGLLNCSGL